MGGKWSAKKKKGNKGAIQTECIHGLQKQREHEGFCRGRFFSRKNSKAELSAQKIFKIQNTINESDF